MTLKRKMTDELSSGSFQRNVNSSRFQCLEGTFENYRHIFSETVNTKEDSDRLSLQIFDLMSRTRNTADAYYPKSDDGGEVVAMGTEDTNACGLLEGGEGGRLFGKYQSIYIFFFQIYSYYRSIADSDSDKIMYTSLSSLLIITNHRIRTDFNSKKEIMR
jgi:hypothetical protein